MTKKKVTKKKVVKKTTAKQEPEIKCLSEVEMQKMEIFNKDLRIKELETLVMVGKKRISDLEFENERLKKHNEYSALKERKSSFLKVLTEKYELRSELKGFDPITGEIKDE